MIKLCHADFNVREALSYISVLRRVVESDFCLQEYILNE